MFSMKFCPIKVKCDKNQFEKVIEQHKRLKIGCQTNKCFSTKIGTLNLLSSDLYQVNTCLNYNHNFDYSWGVLQYPSDVYTIKATYDSEFNYSVEAHTIDMIQDWNEIEKELLK